MSGAAESRLFLARTIVDGVRLREFAARARVLDDDLGYALHLALRRRYGALAPQPFRLMPAAAGAAREGCETLLGYAADADGLVQAAAAAGAKGADDGVSLPVWDGDWAANDNGRELLEAVFPAPFETRPMPDLWRAGQHLDFEVRIRPVRRHGPKARAARTAAGKPAGERDAFLSAVEGRDKDTHDRTRESVYAEWLAERFGAAATIEGASRGGDGAGFLREFRRTRLYRPHGHGKDGRDGTRRTEGPDALMAGTLRIGDPDAFAALLAGGVGRHTAFGFGMLLLKPAGN